MIPGSIIFGYLSDKLGRKKVLGLDLFFFLVFGTLASISTNFAELFTSRLLLGVGIGGDYPISSTFMSELSPSKSRGRYLTGAVSMYWVGTAISGLVTLLFLPQGSYFWRYVFLICALLSIPVIIARIRLVESPRWIKSRFGSKEERKVQNKGVSSMRDLFKGRLLKITLFVSGIWFLFDLASYGIGLYYPYVLKELAFPSNYEVVLGTLAISAGALTGYLIAELIVDSLGRRVMLSAGLGGMAFLLYLGGMIKITGVFLVPYFMLFVALEQWAGAVTLFYPTELFPTSVRSVGQGFATAVSRVGSVLGVFYFPIMEKEIGFFNSLLVFATVSLVAFILALLLSKETAKKPLEEISVGIEALSEKK